MNPAIIGAYSAGSAASSASICATPSCRAGEHLSSGVFAFIARQCRAFSVIWGRVFSLPLDGNLDLDAGSAEHVVEQLGSCPRLLRRPFKAARLD